MCGIAGFCVNKQDKSRLDTSLIVEQLLLDIEHRGTDATGIAYMNPKTNTKVITKAPISATEFIKKGLNRCGRARTLIAHTRYATQGSPKNSNNNHPINRGVIVMTHNGHCTNDSHLFKQLNVKRYGQVDSEAITALLAYGKGSMVSRLERIEGNAALAWIDIKNPDTLHLARVRTSPLWIGQSQEGSIYYGSTKQTVENAMVITDSTIDWLYEMQEGEYFVITNGILVERNLFKPMAVRVNKVYGDQKTHSKTTTYSNNYKDYYNWDYNWSADDTVPSKKKSLDYYDGIADGWKV
jgi:glucosamine 6-phosphate synthetase-like amidotransferase/phosphosugar isomerase protein